MSSNPLSSSGESLRTIGSSVKYPTPRGFGFVVLEGRDRTIDRGIKEARADKNGVALAKAAGLIS
jgi:hypothetical protein